MHLELPSIYSLVTFHADDKTNPSNEMVDVGPLLDADYSPFMTDDPDETSWTDFEDLSKGYGDDPPGTSDPRGPLGTLQGFFSRMDPEEISKLCASLSIHSQDEKLWSVRDTLKESAGRKLDLCLVGKVLSNKHVNMEAFRAVIPKIWQTKLEIEVVQDNTFLFYFRNQGDRFRALAGGPWSFDNSLLVLDKLSGIGDIAKLGFNRVVFWVQIPNAPLLCMTREMGEFIGQLIGELVDIDVGVTGECFGKYMHLKVAIDVSKPLKRFLILELVKGEEYLLLLRYEKLPEYCFHYGIIGHSHQECHNKKDSRAASLEFDFDPWLRATSLPGQIKNAGQQQRYRGEKGQNRPGGVISAAKSSEPPSSVEGTWRSKHVDIGSTGLAVSSGLEGQHATSEKIGSVSNFSLAENSKSVGVLSGQTGVSDGNHDEQKDTIAVENDNSSMRKDYGSTIDEVPFAEGLQGTDEVNVKALEVNAVYNALKDQVTGCPVGHIGTSKKTGKWKRWAREGGLHFSDSAGESLADKKRSSGDRDTSTSAEFKKQRMIVAFDSESIEISVSFRGGGVLVEVT
ncbi:hypothetical protein EZV62_010886 [Acer yangbiense]|uniref:DUF4283 domain-containing protein n=1 Tax=Acer yangbiense TaxID=1000413 RepID=A0A5C7I5T6_9ROSI|nr:hypothetical protein EZV62_010886 [Acer yangbiense]